MNVKEILAKCDHTLLLQNATEEDIRLACLDAVKYGTASVCIPPCYVKLASETVKGKTKVCTVVGFPNGYSTKSAKVYETEEAVRDGADEIDMVINVGYLKSGKYREVLEEIQAVKKAANGRTLKVIIETCLLSDEEKIKACRIVSDSGADYIKTSTGFSTGGATPEDIILMKSNVKPHVKVKAAGGISSLTDAEKMIECGADRLGTSRIVKIVKNEQSGGY